MIPMPEAAAVEMPAITQVVLAYGHHYDDADFDSFGELFCLDAQYDIRPDAGLLKVPISGREAIVTAMRGRREQSLASRIQPRHFSTNLVLTNLSAAQASVASFLQVVFAHPDGRIELRRTGVYRDTLRKESGVWRFASRLLELDGVPTGK
jgi:hypothetical protein